MNFFFQILEKKEFEENMSMSKLDKGKILVLN